MEKISKFINDDSPNIVIPTGQTLETRHADEDLQVTTATRIAVLRTEDQRSRGPGDQRTGGHGSQRTKATTPKVAPLDLVMIGKLTGSLLALWDHDGETVGVRP